MYIKHINHKKIIACALGVILGLAPAPALVSAVTVHAYEKYQTEDEIFLDNLNQAITNVFYDLENFLEEANEQGGNPVNLYTSAQVISMQNSFYQNLKWSIDSNSEMSGDGTSYVGYYTVNGGSRLYSGSITYGAVINPSGTDIVTSPHFTFTISYNSSNLEFNPSNLDFDSSIDGAYYQYHAINNDSHSCRVYCFDSKSFFSGQVLTSFVSNSNRLLVAGVGTSADIPNHKSGSNFSRNGKIWLGSGAIPHLPDLGVPMDKAHAQDYFSALQDYLRTNFPDVPSQFIADPDNVDDNVTLPTSPHIGLNAEKGNLSDLNLDLEPYSSGFDFWWWLTDSVLTDLHLRTVVLLLIALGSVGFIVWKVGR